MNLDGALLAFVSEGAPWAREAAESLRTEGADVRECAPDRDLWSVLAGAPFVGVVLADVGEEVVVRGLVRALQEEPRTRWLATMLLRGEGSPVAVPTGVIALEGTGLGLQVASALAQRLRGERSSVAPRESSRAGSPGSTPSPASRPGSRKVSGVAHDVRVLLGIAVGFAANLRDGLVGPVNDAQRDHARRTVEAATDASGLLERLVQADSSEGVASAPPPRMAQRTYLDLGHIVDGVLRLFEGHAGDREIQLVHAGIESVHVWGDALQLKQLATNLLVNAIKFTPRGGKVEVSVQLREPTGKRGMSARRVATFIVSDTGPGVPPADRERIFEAGVRLERDRRIAGRGIGLSVVRDVVTRHGGNVEVGASPEGGAEFVVRLPQDLRGRARDALVVLRDPASVEKVVQALERARRAGTLAASRKDVLAALEACGAVVVVPDGADLIGALDDDPPGNDG
jgi:nitrogen-specific signal transduction histidine kinase